MLVVCLCLFGRWVDGVVVGVVGASVGSRVNYVIDGS